MNHDPFSTPINFGNQEYIDKLLRQYRNDPQSISGDWGAFFQGMEFVATSEEIQKKSPTSDDSNSFKIKSLIDSYRRYGHFFSRFNPTKPPPEKKPYELTLQALGFSQEDLSKPFPTLGLFLEPTMPLDAIISRLEEVYCQTIAFEFEHIDDFEMRQWLHERVLALSRDLDEEVYKHLTENLFRAKELEAFLQKKFLGAKRFSLEGAETFLPIMEELVDHAAGDGIQSVIIGMAHRGRLNTLCNLLKKPYSLLFHEFSGETLPTEEDGLGDVKYHKGYSQETTTWSGRKIHLTLAANPSHLEAVDPVVMGMSRAKQQILGGIHQVLPILVHGDASIAGQGVVYETMQMLHLQGYQVGGCIHIVINNQVGFTAEAHETRSTPYCTDIAKAFSAPVIHVNAEDPAACLKAALLAYEVRHRFHVDVFIDLNGHRLYGHNEADEPKFTNPQLYETIKHKDHIYHKFSQHILNQGLIKKEELESIEQTFRDELNQAFSQAEQLKKESSFDRDKILGHCEEMAEKVHIEEVVTQLPLEKLRILGHKITHLPTSFTPHPKLRKLFEARAAILESDPGQPKIDWATAELLTYATLVEEGVPVRISGEDSKRGTFSHRHATLVDQKTGEDYTPIAHLSQNQASFEVYSSHLSEFGVMGFDFGYSLVHPKALVIWEGQFGDFANGAQIIIDQFIAGCETKWGHLSNLTLFLPHGFEAMGPEHSSCRLERFLQLTGLDNMRVVYPSTPAQMFHLLRRQALSPTKKPLIIPTPKSMLRLSASFSTLYDLATGSFMPIISDTKNDSQVEKLLLCTGKIYHELAGRREAIHDEKTVIIRIEQLYPLPIEKLKEAIAPFNSVKEVCFVQEEPQNQGAWEFLHPQLSPLFPEKTIRYIGRPRSSIPDTGYAALYKIQQEAILREAIGEK